jgi:hypothetical protein
MIGYCPDCGRDRDVREYRCEGVVVEVCDDCRCEECVPLEESSEPVEKPID